MRYKIAVVEWVDARVCVDGEMPELPIMRSIGVIILDDKEKICICSLFGTDNDPRIITAIPKSLVKNINWLVIKKGG